MRTMLPEERFLARIDYSNRAGCWRWLGSISASGHGQASLRGHGSGAHRIMFELYHGAIPAGMIVRHRCDNPACVRIDHLELGTIRENAIDYSTRQRGYAAKPAPEYSDMRAAREQAGIGLREMARMIGIDPSALVRWESGKWKPKQKHAERWAAALEKKR